MLNYKIVFNTINIYDYPLTEEYLEKMAKMGWLLHKIALKNIFIFKKIENADIEYSIVPFDYALAENEKSKIDFDEYRDLIESSGWNYIDRTNIFQVYYNRGIDNIDIFTDRESEYNSLVKVTKRKLITTLLYVLLLIVFVFLEIKYKSYLRVEYIRDIKEYILPITIFLYTFLNIFDSFCNIIFIYKNSKLNGEIKFFNSNTLNKTNRFFSFIYIIYPIILAIILLYFYFYIGDKIDINRFFLPFIPLVVMSIHDKFNKKKKVWTDYREKDRYTIRKVITVFIMIIVVFFLASEITQGKLSKPKYSENIISDYSYLKTTDFNINTVEKGSLIEKKSFLTNIGYNYISGEKDSIITEYTDCRNENIAKELFNRYIADRKKGIRNIEEVLESFRSDNYPKDGLSKNELIDRNTEIEVKKNIIEVDNNIWDVDEGYYLSNNKESIVLRKGNIVYYFSGIDFSVDKNIEIVKNKFAF